MKNKNEQISEQLNSERENLKEFLLNIRLTDEFLVEYNDLVSGRGFKENDNDPELLSLKKCAEDNKLNEKFQLIVNGISSLSEELIINEFKKSFMSVFGLMKSNSFQNSSQALFVEYDYYGHKNAWVGVFGKWNWELMINSAYLKGNWYEDKIFELGNAITFINAWPEFVEMEFDKIDNEFGLEISDRLISLYKLNSRILLHHSLKQIDEEGGLDFLNIRPFHFFINEHDCEVSSLYIKE